MLLKESQAFADFTKKLFVCAFEGYEQIAGKD